MRMVHQSTVLLTGSSRGIGAATRSGLEQRGVKVIGHATTAADEATVGVDLSDPSGAERLWTEALDRANGQIDALICNPKGIFGVYSLREVSEYTKFWAIGSGSEFALGAMHALYDRLDSAEEIAKAGVEAGAEFNNASSLPMSIQVIDLESE